MRFVITLAVLCMTMIMVASYRRNGGSRSGSRDAAHRQKDSQERRYKSQVSEGTISGAGGENSKSRRSENGGGRSRDWSGDRSGGSRRWGRGGRHGGSGRNGGHAGSATWDRHW